MTRHHPQSRGVAAFDLVVLDLDGTIIDPHTSADIRPAVREAVAAVGAAGVLVSIVTGRSLDYVRAHIQSLELTCPVVTTQGAILGDPVTGEVLEARTIPLELAREVAAWVDSVNRLSVFYFLGPDGRTRMIQNQATAASDYLDHILGYPREVGGPFVALFDGPHAQPPLKYMTLNERENEPDIQPELERLFGDRLHAVRTHPALVEATMGGVDKGTGVLRLCARLGISPARVLAIGDNDNDIPVLEVVGVGVAMENATPGLKTVADWTAPSLEEDGAAIAMRYWILGQD